MRNHRLPPHRRHPPLSLQLRGHQNQEDHVLGTRLLPGVGLGEGPLGKPPLEESHQKSVGQVCPFSDVFFSKLQERRGGPKVQESDGEIA